MSPITTEFSEISWTKDGKDMKACFPRDTAQIFMNKHLIPQQNQGIISNVKLI